MEHALVIADLDPVAIEWIEQEARRTRLPVEVVARQLIYRGLEARRDQASQPPHHDLDALAGTWTPEEAEEFAQATASLREVDQGLWP